MEPRDAVINCLPDPDAVLVGRVWIAGPVAGPAVVTVQGDQLHDVSKFFPTVSELLNRADPAAELLQARAGAPSLPLQVVLETSPCIGGSGAAPALLAPCDLQALKACGVTFMVSLMERLIEERAGGDPQRAERLRGELLQGIGANLRAVRPGSDAAAQLKQALQQRKMWSQYLEAAIGPDAEVFTKAQPLSAVGHGMEVGIHPASRWNNPEPEIVLAVNRHRSIVGATLGNDVNLRDVEGRSALLLGQAKDNNGACAIGPFIRLFHGDFTLDVIRSCTVSLRVEGPDGFQMSASSHMAQISRDPEELVRQTINAHHSYPDGLMLFLGTMFAPTADRDAPGLGFTHRVGDLVEISTPALGSLVNRINFTDRIPPWNFGVADLLRNLAARGLV
ncbi:MAG: fumarylacetoacetate hydrolase family protein [Gammaproteobacteria bacterium]|nr:fumarylacetoacetate hydrolase family protein [Gammaproteobacteria bacterium]